MIERLDWNHTQDGFAICETPLADILEELGIHDTGLSAANPADVQSYYDDWYLFSVTGAETVYGLIKMREQEYDYVPGYSDADNPSVTVSFVAFDIALLKKLEDPENRGPALRDFVGAFRRVTELSGQRHNPILQQYFSAPTAQAPYIVAELYLKKLLRGAVDGQLPLPNMMKKASKRVLRYLQKLNTAAGRTICDLEAGRLIIADPTTPTIEEQYCLLITHTGDPDFNCFAAEVKFHADALVSWENRIPGQKKWYASALRADMQIEPDDWFRVAFFAPYYHRRSKLVRQQAAIHGRR